MRKQTRVPFGVTGTFLLLLMVLLTACGGGMSEDERAIAVAVALTQTAVAIEADTAISPIPTEAATPAAATDGETAPETPTTPEIEEASAAAAPTATPLPTEVAAPTAAAASTPETAAAADGGEAATAATTPLTVGELPVTQNSLKIRTLLVAPGEPGALYVLLTNAADDTGPATGARFLISRDFGRSWSAAPSGLPVGEDCLFNVNMDYYGPTALYASTCQGIYRWSESDDTWTVISEEQTGMVAVVYGNDNLIWATRPYGVEGAPVLLSQNGGADWQEIDMAHTNGVATIGISPRDSQSGYAVVWPGGEGSDLRRGSFVQEWRLMPVPGSGLPLNPGMTIDGGTGWLYVTTAEAEGDRLWRSSDPDTPVIEDVSWSEVHRFAPEMTVTLLASGWSSEEDQLAVYANIETTTDGEPRFTLVRSLDSGVTWEPLIVDAG